MFPLPELTFFLSCCFQSTLHRNESSLSLPLCLGGLWRWQEGKVVGRVTLDLVHYVCTMNKAQRFAGHFSLTAQAQTLNPAAPFTTVLATSAWFVFPLPYFFFPPKPFHHSFSLWNITRKNRGKGVMTIPCHVDHSARWSAFHEQSPPSSDPML